MINSLLLLIAATADPQSVEAAQQLRPGEVMSIRRGEGPPLLDAWVEGGLIHILQGRSIRCLEFGRPAGRAMARPDPPPLSLGKVSDATTYKYRHGAWWHLEVEDFPRRWLRLFKRELEGEWTVWAELPEASAVGFEVMGQDQVLLAGYRETERKPRHLAALVSDKGTVRTLKEIPYPIKGDGLPVALDGLLWSSCLTTQDGEQVYLYFPGAGRLYGVPLQQPKVMEYREPWKRLDLEAIHSQLRKPIKEGFPPMLNLTEHPGMGDSFFMPMGQGKVVLVGRSLDTEREEAFSASTGARPAVPMERTRAWMLSPNDPACLDLQVPDARRFEALYWDGMVERLLPLAEVFKEKKPVAKGAPAKGKGQEPATRGPSVGAPKS